MFVAINRIVSLSSHQVEFGRLRCLCGCWTASLSNTAIEILLPVCLMKRIRFVYMCVYARVCVCVCMCVCVCVCVCAWVYVWVCMSRFIYICVCVCVCDYECLMIRIMFESVCVYLCVGVCVYL